MEDQPLTKLDVYLRKYLNEPRFVHLDICTKALKLKKKKRKKRNPPKQIDS